GTGQRGGTGRPVAAESAGVGPPHRVLLPDRAEVSQTLLQRRHRPYRRPFPPGIRRVGTVRALRRRNGRRPRLRRETAARLLPLPVTNYARPRAAGRGAKRGVDEHRGGLPGVVGGLGGPGDGRRGLRALGEDGQLRSTATSTTPTRTWAAGSPRRRCATAGTSRPARPGTPPARRYPPGPPTSAPTLPRWTSPR